MLEKFDSLSLQASYSSLPTNLAAASVLCCSSRTYPLCCLCGPTLLQFRYSRPAGPACSPERLLATHGRDVGTAHRWADKTGQEGGSKPYTSPWDVCWAPKMAQFRHSPMGRSHCALRRTVCRTLCYNRAHCEPRCICMTFCQQTAFLL